MDLAETKTIKIVLNGEAKDIPMGMNIEQLLTWLKMDSSRVAVELNRVMLRKPEWSVAPIDEGAQVEIVWFVGGG